MKTPINDYVRHEDREGVKYYSTQHVLGNTFDVVNEATGEIGAPCPIDPDAKLIHRSAERFEFRGGSMKVHLTYFKPHRAELGSELAAQALAEAKKQRDLLEKISAQTADCETVTVGGTGNVIQSGPVTMRMAKTTQGDK